MRGRKVPSLKVQISSKKDQVILLLGSGKGRAHGGGGSDRKGRGEVKNVFP